MSTQVFSQVLASFPSLSQYTNYLTATPTLPTLDGADIMLLRLKSLITIHLPLLLSIDLSDPRFRAAFLACWAYAVLYYIATPLSRRLVKEYGNLPLPDQVEWNSRICSNVNAVFCTVAAILLFFDGSQPNIWSGILATNPKCDIVFCCFLGYIVVDLVVVLRHYKTISGFGSTVVHHLVAVTSYTIFLVFDVGHLHGVFFLFTEITTPFVNARWFLAKLKMSDTKIYLYNGLCMLVGFLAVRVIMQSYFGFLLWAWLDELATQPAPVFYYLLLQYALITALNTYWFTLIAKGAYKAVFASKSPRVAQ